MESNELSMKNFKLFKVAQLNTAPWNYKENDEEMTEKLMNNLRKNGQIVNMLVRKLDSGKYEVVDGNHRLEAVKRLEWKEVVCYDLGKVTKEQAIEMAIGINEIRFPTEIMKLAENIHALNEKTSLEELSKTLPFSVEELDNILKSYKFDWEEIENKIGESKNELKENRMVECPACGHKFEVKE